MGKPVSTAARRRWLARLRAGDLHEDPARPNTWVLDDVWRAAAFEQSDAEWARVLAMPLAGSAPKR